MADKFIDYCDSMSSPWTYLGHLRFVDLAILRAVWVEDRDIADHATLVTIANENGMDASFYAVTVPRYASRTAGSFRSSEAGPWRVMRPRSSTKP